MSLELGEVKQYKLEPQTSRYLMSDLNLFFCDSLASDYAPVIYEGQFHEPKAEAVYYRIVSGSQVSEFCLQYYVYWLEQVCMGGAIASHKYDYEPIFLFLRPPEEHCYKVVNGGSSQRLDCRFHKTEIRIVGVRRDQEEWQCECKTSPAPFYPFGGKNGQGIVNCVKRYPLEASVYFLEHHPVFGLRECSHVFSGDANYFSEPRMKAPLRRLTDSKLDEWYHKHCKSEGEEPFGHDVSNPFEFPHIKYFDPKKLLRSEKKNR